MHLATYNLLKGGPRRVHWSRLLEVHGVDLLLVQESYAPEEHMPPLVYPQLQSRAIWQTVEHGGWGSGVFAREGKVQPVPVPGFAGWVAGAELRGAPWLVALAEPLLVFSVHAPARQASYTQEVNRLLDEVVRIASGREVVLGGDFNLAIHPGAQAIDPALRGPNRQELAIQKRLREELGLINCWAAAKPGQSPPQTLRWTKAPSVPYHCDGLFVPQRWLSRLTSCTVLSGDDWSALSDHNPVLARFDCRA